MQPAQPLAEDMKASTTEQHWHCAGCHSVMLVIGIDEGDPVLCRADPATEAGADESITDANARPAHGTDERSLAWDPAAANPASSSSGMHVAAGSAAAGDIHAQLQDAAHGTCGTQVQVRHLLTFVTWW
jgi:hypothetical protein